MRQLRITIAVTALITAAVMLAGCGGGTGGTGSPELRASCGVTATGGQTGISVIMWQPTDSGTVIHVNQVTADWYGTEVTVSVDRDVPWLPGSGYVEVDRPLPPSLYGNSAAAGCKVLSWR